MDYNESPLYSPPKPENYMATGLGLTASVIVLTGLLVFTLLI